MAEQNTRRHGPRGPHGGMAPGEKAKDFRGTMKKLMTYIGKYKFAVATVIVFAIGSTIFSIIGPKILSKATTELFNGLVAKIKGTGGIDFDKIGKILLILLTMYLVSAVFSFIQGWIMTGVTQKLCFRFRKEISEKIDRMPMKYFESRTVGEVLSRITNDVDTLGQSLNQCDDIDHIRDDYYRSVDHDAYDQSVDDIDRICDPPYLRTFDQSGHQTFAEVFLYTAGIPWKDQRTGRRSVQRTECYQSV